jgi:hypothetical protein
VSSLWLGIPTEAWALLDPAVREALREKRITPEELHEPAGWCYDGPTREGEAWRRPRLRSPLGEERADADRRPRPWHRRRSFDARSA